MIVVNPNTRQFNIPGSDLIFGVVADSGSEVKYFQCPRYVGNNLDIMACFVRVNYRNANGETDSYLVNDLTLDGDNVNFNWELAPKVTAYKGQVKFVMCAVGPDLKVKWHTTLGTGQVHDGLEPDQSHVEDETADVVAQLIAMVEAQTAEVESVGKKWVADVKSEGATQVQAVKTASETAQASAVAEIEAKGVNTRNSIPDDYTAMQSAVDALTHGRAGAIVCEVSGETVCVSDASDLPMQGLRAFGKTKQITTTGAQMFDKGTAVTGMLEENGSITVDGAYVTSDFIPVTPKTAYHQTKKDSIRAKYYDENKNPLSETWDVQIVEESTFTTFEKAHFIRLTVSVKLVDTFMLNLGNEGLPYEPYSGGRPSPSPDYPQELHSLKPVVTVCGKNLFKMGFEPGYTETVRGVTFTVNSDRGIHVSGTPTAAIAYNIFEGEVFPVGKYFVSGAPATASQKFRLQVNLTVNGLEKTGGVDMGEGSKMSVDASVSSLRGYIYVASDAGEVNDTFYPQLEFGSEGTGYAPYSTQTVKLTHTLPGIPVTSGGNYTDSEGQQWICNEIDLERGVYVQRVGVTELTEADWTQNSSGKYFSGKNRGVYSTAYRVLCTHINGGTASDGNKENVIFINANRDIRLNITLEDNTIETVTSAMNGAILVGVLNAPVETPLSETELAAYRALHSNYPNTTVLNDSGAHMVVKYAADTKLYIDNKINALLGG